jgi:hypothetical protein
MHINIEPESKLQVWKKPSLEELVTAQRYLATTEQLRWPTYHEIYKKYTVEFYEAKNKYESAERTFEYNEKALRSSEFENYDQTAFGNLIANIEYNGKSSFNMGTFLGFVENLEDSLATYGINSIHQVPNVLDLDNSPHTQTYCKTTEQFNCDTVGCIAGFATANALNWANMDFLHKETIHQSRFFEHVSCNYLNIPTSLGSKVFYGQEGSMWSFLRSNTKDFNNLTVHVEYSNDEYDQENILEEYSYEEFQIDLKSISYKDATFALTMLKEGVLRYDHKNDFYLA